MSETLVINRIAREHVVLMGGINIGILLLLHVDAENDSLFQRHKKMSRHKREHQRLDK